MIPYCSHARRGDSGLVRHGAAQAVVTATFDAPAPESPLALLFDENGLEIERGEPLIVKRIVKADGGSRGFVNDQPASAGLLREMAPHLVEIHGQHDERGLLNARGHRALLDIFGRTEPGATGKAYAAFRSAEAELAAEIAVKLANGQAVTGPTSTAGTPTTLLSAVVVTRDTIMATVVADGLYTVAQICAPEYAAACAAAGIR